MTGAEFVKELLFPLRNSALLSMIVATTLLLSLARAAKLFGLVLGLLVSLALLKYLIDVLQARAMNRKVPVPDVDTFNPGLQVWKLGVAVVTFVFVFAIHHAASGFGSAGALAATVISLAVWPAMVINASISQNVAAMFAVPTLVKIAQAMGRRYWAIGLAMLCSLAMWQLTDHYLNTLLGSVLANYAQVMVYSFAGAMVYHSRDELGLDVRRSPEGKEQRRITEVERRRYAYLDRAYVMFSRGNAAGGKHVLNDLVESEPASLAFDRWIFDILADWSEPTAMLLFAPRL
ncbi:MAG: hypothetical protein AAF385_11925, partial [Pseudomonadota bacterium]